MHTCVEVIINARSGSTNSEDVERILREVFSSCGVDARIRWARSGGHVVELARSAAEGSAETIVAGGGDGTVSAVASVLVGTEKRLGVLPLGTLNHFAKDLKIPLAIADAARTVVEGRTKSIDVGEVNGFTFINNSSLGLYPTLVKKRSTAQRLGYGKWLALVWALLSVFRRYPLPNVRLCLGGEELAHHTPFVFIGNNEYEMEGFRIGARARLDAGVLSLYMTSKTGRLGLLKLAVRALFGRLRYDKDFYATSMREVWIETRRRRLDVARDGEITVMEAPLHYRVLANALKVIVPNGETPQPSEQGY